MCNLKNSEFDNEGGNKVSKVLLKSKMIYTSDGLKSGAILIEDSKIKDIIFNTEEIRSFEGKVIDVENNSIIPGLIDIHIHGAGGWTVTGGTVEDIKGLTTYLTTRGVTSFQPTIGGSPLEAIKNTLKELSIAIKNKSQGTRILGIHLEGPFLNPEKKGAFSLEFLEKPSVELVKEFIELSNDNIIHVSLAPELEGAKEVIEYLVDKGILVSGAHTNATIEETKKAIRWGVSLSNHTCNAQRSIHHREPGALGGYLLDDGVDCELICDSFHVHPDMIRLVTKIKTIDKICVISDAITASGVKPGEYAFLGRKALIDKDGWSRLPDGTIAGSTRDLLYGLENLVENIGYSMEDALKMTSLNPARLSGYQECKGSIEVGKDADLVILDENYKIKYTFVEGEMVYSSEQEGPFTNPKIQPIRSIEEVGDEYEN
nr:N-acetylglucosamine-6-phosphate deacetylase [Sporosalibacterium faouarense]